MQVFQETTITRWVLTVLGPHRAGPFSFCSITCCRAFCDWYENMHRDGSPWFEVASEKALPPEERGVSFTCDNCNGCYPR